jgi:hypothetical protein
MRQRLRENALCASIAAAGCATMAWIGLYGFGWNDYETESRPAFDALAHGHVLGFLRLAPAYGGSLIERAPFALVPDLWGGGALAVYRMVALPCLLAAAALGIWLVARMRAQGRPRLARAITLAICVANPITVRTLEYGHPEELLGACLCVAAVLVASRSSVERDRSLHAGVLLGLAVANKDWALVAAGPVLLALPAGRRRASLIAACATCAVILAPLLLASAGGFVASTRAVATTLPAAIFKPWQLWWFFGHYSPHALGPSGLPQHGYRVGPGWVGAISHPIVLGAGLLLAGALWLRNRRTALPEQQALLALAFVLLLRCVLDSWDEFYYLLPFIFAVLAWEISREGGRPPLLALVGSALVWLSFVWLPEHASANAQASVFLLWSVPLALWLGARLFTAGEETRAAALTPASAPRGYETTVSALGRRVKTS